MEIRAHKGGRQEGVRWLTTDRDHAAGFGKLETYRVTCPDKRVGRYTMEELEDRRPEIAAGGWEADEAMQEVVEEDGHWLALLEGWEGSGTVLWVARPDCVLGDDEEPKSFRSYIKVERVEG